MLANVPILVWTRFVCCTLLIMNLLLTIRTHLNGSLSHDLAQLGDVIILLNGSSEVAVILRFRGVRLAAKSAL